jgi:hypothetical protein
MVRESERINHADTKKMLISSLFINIRRQPSGSSTVPEPFVLS